MAGVISRDGVCSFRVMTISDLVFCVGHFKVRRAEDSVMEPLKNLGCRSVITKLWPLSSKTEKTPEVD